MHYLSPERVQMNYELPLAKSCWTSSTS